MKKRLTLIGPVYPYRGGIAHFTTLLAGKLLEDDFDVQVISFKSQYPAWLYPGKSDKDFSEGRIQTPAQFLLQPFNPFSWIKVIHAVRQFNPDQIVFQWWTTFWGPCYYFLLLWLKKYIRMAIVHNVLPHEIHFFDRWVAKAVLEKMNKIILMSEQEKKRLLEILKNNPITSVSPHPVYSLFPSVTVNQSQAREQLGIKEENQPVLLFFGLIRAYKGLKDLLVAIKRLKDNGIIVKLIIAGEFWENKNTYVALINELTIESQIIIYDEYIPDNMAGMIFKAADIFVAPYRSGTQSGVVKAALSFGLPIVMTEVIADKIMKDLFKNVCIVPTSDPDFLVHGIRQALKYKHFDTKEIQIIADESWHNFVNIIFLTKHQSAKYDE